jgi:hypothetical protein
MHVPGHLREAFCEWAETPGEPPADVEIDGEERPLRWIVGQLWNCSDIMPRSVCDSLFMPPGSTYAGAVQSIRV